LGLNHVKNIPFSRKDPGLTRTRAGTRKAKRAKTFSEAVSEKKGKGIQSTQGQTGTSVKGRSKDQYGTAKKGVRKAKKRKRGGKPNQGNEAQVSPGSDFLKDLGSSLGQRKRHQRGGALVLILYRGGETGIPRGTHKFTSEVQGKEQEKYVPGGKKKGKRNKRGRGARPCLPVYKSRWKKFDIVQGEQVALTSAVVTMDRLQRFQQGREKKGTRQKGRTDKTSG